MCEDDAAIWGTQTFDSLDTNAIVYSHGGDFTITNIGNRTEVDHIAIVDAIMESPCAISAKSQETEASTLKNSVPSPGS